MVEPSTLFLTVGAGVLTYIGGVLTKPLQDRIAERRESQRLRKALYIEMGKLLSHHQYIIEEIERDETITRYWELYVKGLWPNQCFDLAQKNPITLNLLPDTMGITHFFRGAETLFEAYQKIVAEGKPMALFSVSCFVTVIGIHFIIQKGELSKKRLMEFGDERARAFLQGDLSKLRNLLNHFERLSVAN